MEELADVVIVSIFGRGNWLASELATRGWRVTLVDVSSRMGAWEPEDYEGPFGLLEDANLLATQKARLMDDGDTVVAPNGFTFWLPDGPFEGKSELTTFQLEQRSIPKVVENYLRKATSSRTEAESLRPAVRALPFSANWLAQFAHQFASTVHVENYRCLEVGRPAPLFSPLLMRHATRVGHQRGLKNTLSSGASVRANAGVRDIRLVGNTVDAVEVEDDRAGIERGRAFVWMLSGEESLRFPTSVHATLFPNGAMGPDWYWTRFQVRLGGKASAAMIPPWFVTTRDRLLPWTHANLMIVRTRKPVSDIDDEVDVWMRIPLWARFDFKYLQTIRDEMEAVLAERIPQSAPVTTVMPLEAQVSREKLGPPRHPVYNQNSFARTQPLRAKNLFFDSPDLWRSLDWSGQFENQRLILAGLEKLKQKQDEASEREARRAAQDLDRRLKNPRSPEP
jgi:hypothetical protein